MDINGGEVIGEMSEQELDTVVDSLVNLALDGRLDANCVSFVPILRRFGDLLRDEPNRSDEKVIDNLPKLIDIVKLGLSESIKSTDITEIEPIVLEIARYLCNLVANNDFNAQLFINDAEFLGLIGTILSIQDEGLFEINGRLISGLSNLINCNSSAGAAMTVVVRPLFNYIIFRRTCTGLDDLEQPIELLGDLVLNKQNFSDFDLADFSASLTFLDQLLDGSDEFSAEDYDDMMVTWTKLIYKLSDFEISPNQPSVQLSIFGNLRKLDNLGQSVVQSISKCNRMLFASSGNISSNPMNPNSQDIQLALDMIERDDTAFVLSASAIILGNYIQNEETKLEILSKIDINQLFNCLNSFYDIVQYQALHLLSNLLTDLIVEDIILNHLDAYARISKALFDNKTYYKEVVSINMKVMKKMFRAINERSLRKVIESGVMLPLLESNFQDDIVGNDIEEIYCIMIQTMVLKKMDITPEYTLKLTQLLLKLRDQLSITNILEKTKTIGILLGNGIVSSTSPTEFLSQYTQFLVDLEEKVLRPEANHSQAGFNVLVNNSKFVAAKSLAIDVGDRQQLETACNRILAYGE